MYQRAQQKASFNGSSNCCTTADNDGGNRNATNGVLEECLQQRDGDYFRKKQRLYEIVEMPAYLQFNKYVQRGYRPLSTAWGCIVSLFAFHNETVNILTHGIPLAYIVFHASELLPFDQIEIRYLPYLHILSTISPWLGSFIYHLFMNHKLGEGLYYTLLKGDMVGIWITQSFGALTTIYASTFCLPTPAIVLIFGLYFFLSLLALYKAMVANSPRERSLSFLLLLILRTGLLVLRLSPYGGGNPLSFLHVILQDLISVIGGVIGALRIPELWFPGRFDYLGNSHNIMHVLVVTAIVHMHKAAKLDLHWMSQGISQCASPK